MSIYHSQLGIEEVLEKIEYFSQGKDRVDETFVSYWSNTKITLENPLVNIVTPTPTAQCIIQKL